VGMITFDGFFLGRLGTDALAGASLAFPFVMLSLQATNSGMGNGVSSAIARALGAGRRDRADALVFHALLLALGLGAIFAGAILFGGPSLFRGMGGQDDMLAAALAYANVALGGAVCICVLNFLGNAVRGTGNMTLPASVLVGCVVAHIALAPLLIFGAGPVPALGPAGAAWGLVLPFAVGSIGLIWYLRSGRSSVQLNFRGVTPRWELFADILKVGVPGLVNIAVTNLSVMALTAVAARLGVTLPSATRWAPVSNTSCSRSRSASAPRSSPWSVRTGGRASIAAPARSRGPVPPLLRRFAEQSG
jgi:MATE family, multidrug efflux pump